MVAFRLGVIGNFGPKKERRNKELKEKEKEKQRLWKKVKS